MCQIMEKRIAWLSKRLDFGCKKLIARQHIPICLLPLRFFRSKSKRFYKPLLLRWVLTICYDSGMKNVIRSVKYVIGIDEVGRGPLAGPVAVGVMASALPARKLSRLFRSVKDSKKLSAQKREEWFARIREETRRGVLIYHVSFVSSRVIDRHGISYALKKAMKMSLMKLACDPKMCRVLLDGGLVAPEEYVSQKTIIKGDEKEILIALASIAAKVLRDRKMTGYGKQYPQYLFPQHKGYGTKEHMERIKQHGISPIHRKSFLKRVDPVVDFGIARSARQKRVMPKFTIGVDLR